MKKILFCGAALVCVASFAQAQGISLRLNQLSVNRLSVTPNIPDVTANADMKANIFSADLMGSFAAFSKKPDNLLRVTIGYTSLSLAGKQNSEYGNNEYDKSSASLSQRSIHLAPGSSMQIAGTDRFNLYTGIDLPISVIGGTNFESEYEDQYYDDVNDSLVKSSSKVEGSMSGGFSFGVSPFLGFAYTGGGPFSLGAEVASGLIYTMIGPDAEAKYYEDGVFQETLTSDVGLTSLSKMPLRLSIVLTYRFMKSAE